MSYILGIVPCEDIQDLLENNFKNVLPLEHLPVTEFVFSDMNLERVLEMNISPGGGKIMNVNLVHVPRNSEEDASEDITFQCTSDNEAGQISTPYTLDTAKGVYVNEKFDIQNLTRMCRSNGSWFASRLLSMQDLALRKLETRLTTIMTTMNGRFTTDDDDLSDTNHLKTVVTRDSDGHIDTDFIGEIAYTAQLAEFGMTPVIFGSGDLTKVMREVKAGCCASYGLDIGEFAAQNEFVYFHSNRLKGIAGEDHFFMLHPGQIQPLWYNLFMDDGGEINNVDTPIYKQTVITDSRYGLPWDYTFKLDCGVVFVEIALAVDLVGLPPTLYNADDRMYGYNGVLEFAIDNP